jgi:hypothetical protein
MADTYRFTRPVGGDRVAPRTPEDQQTHYDLIVRPIERIRNKRRCSSKTRHYRQWVRTRR